MREKKPSVVTPRRVGRGTRFLATTAALAVGAFGGLVAVAASSASASVTTGDYTIGTPTGAVTGAAVTPTSVVSGAGTSWTVSFATPAALATNATITVNTSETLSSAPTSAYLLSGSCLQTTGYTSTTSGLVFTVSCTSGISSGATVDVVFNAGAPTSNFYYEVSTSANSTADNTNTVTVSSVPPTLSAGTVTPGASTVYTISGIGASGAAGGSWSTLTSPAYVIELASSGGATSLTSNASAITWYNAGTTVNGTYTAGSAGAQAGGYTVTYTAPGGTATADSVVAANASTPGIVYLQLNTPVASGGTLTVTADGSNPTVQGANPTVTVTPYSGPTVSSIGTAVGNPETTSVTFGTPVTSPTLSISSLSAGATATYTVSFVASGTVTGGSATAGISFSESTGSTNFSTSNGVLVSDATAGWHFVTSTMGTAPGDFSGTSGGSLNIYLPGAGTVGCPTAGCNIASGDAVTVQVINVTNPGAGTYSDFDVTTAGNPVSTAVPAYTIGATGVAAPTVTVNPNTLGSVATYTISGLYATSAMTGGSTANEIALTAPAGTVFPNASSDYMVMDATTSTGSGTFTLEYYASNYVVLVPPNSINDGDALTITIEDVINPSTSSSTYNIGLTGDVGEASTAAFPGASTTYPNGALVNFSGTIYDFAGGHAFGIPTPKVLTALQKVDPATVVKAGTGATVPTSNVRVGTIVSAAAVTGSPTIYVMGTDGDLHGFSTPTQLVSDGYDTALNVSVPNLAGLTVGTTAGVAGTTVTAAATTADGALVNSSGTIYVLAGGRAFGIPTPKAMAAIKVTDKATTLSGTVSTTLTGATLTNGVLLSIGGQVYVTYLGYAWPFKAMAQLKKDGYGGTAAVPVHALSGVSAVTTYTGS